MSVELKSGIVTGLAIYGVGALLTVIIHLIVGWDYAHGPPSSFFGVLLTLLVGGVRFFITMRGALLNGVEKAMGEFIVHSVVALVIVVFLVWLKYRY